jgi:hypothetical protein
MDGPAQRHAVRVAVAAVRDCRSKTSAAVEDRTILEATSQTQIRKAAEMPTSAPDNVARRAGWIAVLAVASIASSVVFACATPFAALAALAALYMDRRDAFIVTGVTWLANQAVGYGFLHYPHAWDSFAWGVAIGVGAMVSTALAAEVGRARPRLGWALTVPASFAAAFAGYEIALYAATAVLPSDSSAFGLAVVLYILKVNVVAFGGLLVLQYAGTRTGLALSRPSARMTAA